jgi:DNA gyrase subunit A
MEVTERNGRIVASFPVEETDHIMLVTDGGQLIRCPVDGIRIVGRRTQGVIVFSTAADERVVSVERLTEENGESEE